MATQSRENSLSIWQSLNERQQQYLRAIYDTDQEQERARRLDAARGQWDQTPAAVWRWLLYATLPAGHTPLKARLAAKELIDEGTGSTLAALERRALIQAQGHDHGTTYEGRLAANDPQWCLFVKITKRGRAVARAGDPQYQPTKRLPVGTLRAFEWQAFVNLYWTGEFGQDWLEEHGQYVWRRVSPIRSRAQ